MKRLLLSTSIALLLVIAMTGASQAATDGQQLLFKGSIESLETYSINFPLMQVTATGSGYATQLGKYTVSYSVTVNLLTISGSGGQAEFVAANGDRLYATGAGQATETGTPGVVNVVENYTITGGTGRFSDATGTITFDRVVDTNTGITSGTLSGEIDLP